jgi:hypothetical protein
MRKMATACSIRKATPESYLSLYQGNADRWVAEHAAPTELGGSTFGEGVAIDMALLAELDALELTACPE